MLGYSPGMKEHPQGEYVRYEDVPGWVSVDEREPTEEGRYVVIYSYKDKFSRMFIGDYYIAPDGEGYWSATGADTVITHWLDNMIPISLIDDVNLLYTQKRYNS